MPFSEGVTAACVEGIWQGLKVFENEDIDVDMFKNDTMRNIKRSVRTHGRVLGHRKGVRGSEILGYVEAKHEIYIPTYRWVLENKTPDLLMRLKTMSSEGLVVLLDYNTCCDADDGSKPLSHAFLVGAYVEGLYPYGEKVPCAENKQKEKREKQLSLF